MIMLKSTGSHYCLLLYIYDKTPKYCLPLLEDKLFAFIEGQMVCPYWGTNRLPLPRDKWFTLIGGQTDCPY